MKAAVLTRRPGAFSRALAWGGFALLLIPLGALAFFSFRGGHGGTEPGWTLLWYRRALSNDAILSALEISLVVSAFSTVISTALGTLASVALRGMRARAGWRRPLAGAFDGLAMVPLVMPEIATGISLLIWFVFLKIALGTLSLVLAHVTFTLSYVILTVSSRLNELDSSLEEAAFDLGANRIQAFWRVVFPLLWPGVLSAALMAFTLSFDDFLITFFTAGVGSDTLPLKIYSMIKFGVSPEIHALSTLMLAATVGLVLLFFPFLQSRPGAAKNP